MEPAERHTKAGLKKRKLSEEGSGRGKKEKKKKVAAEHLQGGKRKRSRAGGEINQALKNEAEVLVKGSHGVDHIHKDVKVDPGTENSPGGNKKKSEGKLQKRDDVVKKAKKAARGKHSAGSEQAPLVIDKDAVSKDKENTLRDKSRAADPTERSKKSKKKAKMNSSTRTEPGNGSTQEKVGSPSAVVKQKNKAKVAPESAEKRVSIGVKEKSGKRMEVSDKEKAGPGTAEERASTDGKGKSGKNKAESDDGSDEKAAKKAKKKLKEGGPGRDQLVTDRSAAAQPEEGSSLQTGTAQKAQKKQKQRGGAGGGIVTDGSGAAQPEEVGDVQAGEKAKKKAKKKKKQGGRAGDEEEGEKAGAVDGGERSVLKEDAQEETETPRATTRGPRRVDTSSLPKGVLTGEKGTSWTEEKKRSDVKYGRFTPEEDKRIVAAVHEFIDAHGWAREEGWAKLRNSTRSKETKGAWLEIAKCLPERNVKRVYSRAVRILHEGNYKGTWTSQEEDTLRRLVEEHGSNWNLIGEALGRIPSSVVSKWRDCQRTRSGKWSPDEMERLCLLVQDCLRRRAADPTYHVVGGRQVRDDINWTGIVKDMEGRGYMPCLLQWYAKLAPSMVANGEWGLRNDRQLLAALLEQGCEDDFDLDWDKLVPDRSGEVCRKRWGQMKKHLVAGHWDFEEKVEMACRRFAPDLLEGRELLTAPPALGDLDLQRLDQMKSVDAPLAGASDAGVAENNAESALGR